jgi:predicted permease
MKGPLLVVFITIIILLAIWDGVWKLIALWKSARHDQLAWFICLAIFNTVGILPILYILFFQKKGTEPPVVRDSAG